MALDVGKTIGVGLVAACLAPSLAHAAPPEADASAEQEDSPVFIGSAETAFSARRGEFNVSPMARLAWRIRPRFELYARMGAVYSRWRGVDGRWLSGARPSNAMLGLRWIDDSPGLGHRGHVGLAGSVPTSLRRSLSFEDRVALENAASMRGGMDSWLWMPSTAALIVPAGWQWRGERVHVGVDGAVAGLLDVETGRMGVGAQAEARVGVPLSGATIGAYGTVAANTLAGARHASGGLFSDVSLCRRGRERCPAELTLKAGVGTTVRPSPSGVEPALFMTSVGLRWGVRRR